MRDAESALDQVIAFAAERITTDTVALVLGLIGRDVLLDIVEAVATEDAARIFDLAGRIVESGQDLKLVVRELTRLVRDMLLAGDRSVACLRSRVRARRRHRAAVGPDAALLARGSAACVRPAAEERVRRAHRLAAALRDGDGAAQVDPPAPPHADRRGDRGPRIALAAWDAAGTPANIGDGKHVSRASRFGVACGGAATGAAGRASACGAAARAHGGDGRGTAELRRLGLRGRRLRCRTAPSLATAAAPARRRRSHRLCRLLLRLYRRRRCRR